MITIKIISVLEVHSTKLKEAAPGLHVHTNPQRSSVFTFACMYTADQAGLYSPGCWQ